MLTFDEALEKVLALVPAAPVVEVPLASACGLVLACELVADADMPSFDRSAMDGFAVRSRDLTESGARLCQVGEVKTGGAAFPRPLAPGECVAIYTGAEIPAGADAVVMVERTRVDGPMVTFESGIRPRENVRFRGEDVKQGELLLSPGAVLRPQEIAACATFGAPRVRVHPRPTAAVVSTGDELVPPDSAPKVGQIRDSNGAMLAAQATRAGADLTVVRVVRDERELIRAAIEDAARRAGILILTGGVSMGAYDFVAPVLDELGFRGGFHKIRVKPGKPLWFGRRDDVLAFGLPGNPVSSFVIFELLVRPAIEKRMGLTPGPRFESATVAGDSVKGIDREQFVPAKVDAHRNLTFLPWSSSADFVELCRANALARIPVLTTPKLDSPIDFLRI